MQKPLEGYALEEELIFLSDEDLEAAGEVFDNVKAGTAYPPAGTKIGPFPVRYMPGQEP